ncbi:MAG: pentapeptide repeat-containing protein [Cyanobacteria bacterium P01_G01_bin.54]
MQQRQVVLNLLIAFVMSILAGFLYWIPAVFVLLISGPDLSSVIIGWASITVLVVYFFTAVRKGVVAGAVVVAVSVSGAAAAAGAVAGSVTIAVAGSVVVAASVSGAVAVIVAASVAIAGTVAGAVLVTVTVSGAVMIAGVVLTPETVVVTGAIAVAVLLTSLNVYLARRAMQGEPRDSWIRSTAVAIAAWGGTSFRGADLTDADFTKAQLKCCDFRPGKVREKVVSTQLVRTCFQNTKKLELSRPGQTILGDSNVRDLLVNPEHGRNKNFVHSRFYGAYLQGANLENANLKGTNLHHADLSSANLKNANLMKANVLDTNFTDAYLTGAYLCSWNVDKTTRFKNVDCQYIYLLECPDGKGNRDRRPHNPDKVFAPGDFERLYTQLMHTVEILLKGGMNREAFAAAFNQIMTENPDITWDSIQSIEKKGPDVLLTLEVPPETDKAQVERTFDAAYVARLEAQAEAQVIRAQDMKEHAQDMKEIALVLAQQQKSSDPNVAMEFNGPVYGAAGKAGAQTSNAMEDNNPP